MKINLASVFVDDQDKALSFYTETLGFVKKTEMPVGEFKWLTVVSAEDPDGVELVLEPDNHPAVKPFRNAIVADGIPYTSFAVTDVQAEYERLSALGVKFVQEPANMGPWPHMALHITPQLDGLPFYRVSRPESTSPAVGQHSRHIEEQKALIQQAFS